MHIAKSIDTRNVFSYFSDIARITAPSFVPNEQDILRSRAKTTGIIETEFEVEGLYFRLVDGTPLS